MHGKWGFKVIVRIEACLDLQYSCTRKKKKKERKIAISAYGANFCSTYKVLIKFNNIARSSRLLTGTNILCLTQHIDAYQIIQLNNFEHIL